MGQQVAIDEPVRVRVRSLPTGKIAPGSFEWQGRTYSIVALGRQWDEMVEGRLVRSFLVQTSGQNSFELRWDPVEDEWVLHRGWLMYLV
ncbi:MAG: hypothetical protein OXI80_03435 [Caldilineaceae bacterium]|nr:hypothetical protein [Caldilineaceae bacterium]MDE0336700.1 hypothetical protein [Caldilineaceae bacterium]